MSMPVTASVTQCSTCTRVFISRKKYSPSCEQALDRAGRVVADGLGGVDGDLADLRAQLGVDQRRRRLLDQLLVAALDRAVALAEVDRCCRACRRAPGPRRGAGRAGSARGRRSSSEKNFSPSRAAPSKASLELVGLERDAEALAAAAARGLDRDRVADLLGDLRGVLDASRPARWCRARSARRRSASARARAVLEPIASIADGRRPDEGDAGLLAARVAKAAFSARKP